jgi:hypothetical protein
MRLLPLAALGLVLTLARPGNASPVLADRAVARFTDPEAATGAQRFVMMRELVVEAWLVAYERTPNGWPALDDKALRMALDRHVIEAVLGARTLPAPFEARVEQQTADVRRAQELLVGGAGRLNELLVRVSGNSKVGDEELTAILRRRARAELYLEAAVGLSYEPSEPELRAAHAKWSDGNTYEQAAPDVRACLRTMKLREGAQAYHQAVRSKLRLEIVSET